jgi:lipopolysaccharide export system ATP-binding protein
VNSIFSRRSAKRGVNSKNETDLPKDDGVKTTVTESLRTLETEEIGKAYGGRQVVRGVSMQIAQGEVVGLLGPNGAGKTTCFYMIVGLVRPESGRILADGDEITRLPMYLRARQYGISYLPQEPSIFRKLTVEENILAVLEAQQLSWESRRTRTEKLIEQLNLGHVRKTMGYSLSGGERRRVEIARCLAIEPAFILLDEPFSGIDPIAVLELQEIIFDLKVNGIGVLITDHNVRETLSVTDRAYIINDGRILFAGTPGELGRNPEVRRIYLGEKFSMD